MATTTSSSSSAFERFFTEWRVLHERGNELPAWIWIFAGPWVLQFRLLMPLFALVRSIAGWKAIRVFARLVPFLVVAPAMLLLINGWGNSEFPFLSSATLDIAVGLLLFNLILLSMPIASHASAVINAWATHTNTPADGPFAQMSIGYNLRDFTIETPADASVSCPTCDKTVEVSRTKFSLGGERVCDACHLKEALQTVPVVTRPWVFSVSFGVCFAAVIFALNVFGFDVPVSGMFMLTMIAEALFVTLLSFAILMLT